MENRPYEHTPLPSDSQTSFRLIELLPGVESDLVDLRLHLSDWSLAPQYDAISYAWGDAKDTLVCRCDGKPLKITRSLHGGLINLRLERSSRYLGADAIWNGLPRSIVRQRPNSCVVSINPTNTNLGIRLII
jgi:hypothetical protein